MELTKAGDATIFKRYLFLFDSFSYYLDDKNGFFYFLGNSIESPGNNGRMNIRYYFEEYKIQSDTVFALLKETFVITEIGENRKSYSITNDGFLVFQAPAVIKRVKLDSLKLESEWWDFD